MSDWLFFGCDNNTCKARGSDILEMDKELKKTIDTLSASVKAIQADLLTLKGDCKIAHSDNNSQSSSQYSDLVSGNGPAKKRRRILEEVRVTVKTASLNRRIQTLNYINCQKRVGPLLRRHLSQNWTMQLGRHML